MKFLIYLMMTSLLLISCSREDQAGAVGSGAGIQEEEERSHSDADGGEDMNITTPIYDPEEEE